MIESAKRVLVICPHTDDEIACAGTLARLAEQINTHITIIAFSACEKSIPEGFSKHATKLEFEASSQQVAVAFWFVGNFPVRRFPKHRQTILQALIEIRRQQHYDLVFTPCSGDRHQDHQVIHEETKRAFPISTILGYIHFHNVYYVPTNLSVRLEEKHVNTKIKMIRQYESQATKLYHNEAQVRATMATLGIFSKSKYAECFELINGVL